MSTIALAVAVGGVGSVGALPNDMSRTYAVPTIDDGGCRTWGAAITNSRQLRPSLGVEPSGCRTCAAPGVDAPPNTTLPASLPMSLPTPSPTIEPDGCRAYGRKTADEAAFLGDSIGITLTLRAECTARRFGLHIVVVMDGSEAMAGDSLRRMQRGAVTLVRDLDLADYPSTRVGVVAFDTRARRLCGLMNDEARLLNCIRRVEASGDASIEAGLLEAHKTIQSARRDLARPDDATEVVVLFSNGHNAAGCDEAERASRRLHGAGVLTMAICVASDCDDRCMRDLATAPRYFFRMENIGGLQGVFDQIRSHIQLVSLRRVTVTDTLPFNMRLVADSAQPAPTMISAERDQLTWTDTYIPREGVTYTFRVQPLERGAHATNLEARAALEANTGWKGEFMYPVPTVWVKPPPTPTIRYVIDRTPTPAPTKTPMRLPPWTSTPTTSFTRLWLPLAVHHSPEH